jgi:hypothetical protein
MRTLESVLSKKHEKSKKNDLLAAAEGLNCILMKYAIILKFFSVKSRTRLMMNDDEVEP